MFDRQLTYLLDTLEISVTGLAGYARMDRTSISRMKNGSRQPKQNGTSIRKLIHGIIRYCEENGKTDILRVLIGTGEGSSQEDLAQALKSWLCKDSVHESTDKTDLPAISGTSQTFGVRLNAVMELADISNIRLSRLVYADASLISRYRSSRRRPKSGSDMAARISSVLWERFEKTGRIQELCDLMDCSEADETAFYAWLFDSGRETKDSTTIAGKLISLMNTDVSEPQASGQELPVLPETEIRDVYHGTEGLRKAALRFLKDAAELRVPQMFLYSDEDMGWLSGDRDFFRMWAVLMRICTENHTKITIIHHVNRSLKELNDAVTGWLPLYLSGMVSSYFCRKDDHSLFTDTMFLIPGKACIRASHVKGTEADGIYHYHTGSRSLIQLEKEFRSLIAQASPLFAIRPGIHIPESRKMVIIRNTLPLAAMSKETVQSFNSTDLYLQWEAARYRVGETGYESITEYIPLFEPEAYRKQEVVTESIPGIPQSAYTEEQYRLHTEDIRKLAEEHPGYHPFFLRECPYDNVQIFIADDRVAVIRMYPSPITFETSHPQICRTFLDYAQHLQESFR